MLVAAKALALLVVVGATEWAVVVAIVAAAAVLVPRQRWNSYRLRL